MSAEEVAVNLDQGRAEASFVAKKAAARAGSLMGADDLCGLELDLRRGIGLVGYTMTEMGVTGFTELTTHIGQAEAIYGSALNGSNAQEEVLAGLGVARDELKQGAEQAMTLYAKMERIQRTLRGLIGDLTDLREGRRQLSNHYRGAATGARQTMEADTDYRINAGLLLPEE